MTSLDTGIGPVPTQTQEPVNPFLVVGIDLSLTGTGIALIGSSGIRTDIVKSTGKAGASLHMRQERLRTLLDGIVRRVPDNVLVVIEQPAYSQTGGSHHDRSGLWWLVVDWFMQDLATVVEVTPGGVKKYATGKGNASKDQVLAATVKRYPQADVTDNNIADALVLAAMGARHLGHPVEESMPVVNLAAMDAVRWLA